MSASCVWCVFVFFNAPVSPNTLLNRDCLEVHQTPPATYLARRLDTRTCMSSKCIVFVRMRISIRLWPCPFLGYTLGVRQRSHCAHDSDSDNLAGSEIARTKGQMRRRNLLGRTSPYVALDSAGSSLLVETLIDTVLEAWRLPSRASAIRVCGCHS